LKFDEEYIDNLLALIKNIQSSFEETSGPSPNSSSNQATSIVDRLFIQGASLTPTVISGLPKFLRS
jgi:hypothetical protein